MSEKQHPMGIGDLRRSEAAVAEFIDYQWGALSRNYPELIDLLLKLPYFVGPEEPVVEGNAFQFFARTHYLQAPYTLWSLFTIWRQGHYLESTILVRYLLEVVVQLRYFQANPGKLVEHMTPGRGIRFRTMFESLSPGFYNYFYGNLLSTLAHGKTGPFLFRFDHSQPGGSRLRMGCEYDEEAASMVMNQTLVLLFSFFNLFGLYFPKNCLAGDIEAQAKVDDAIAWLEHAMAEHKRNFPVTLEWYKHVDRFVRV